MHIYYAYDTACATLSQIAPFTTSPISPPYITGLQGLGSIFRVDLEQKKSSEKFLVQVLNRLEL